MKVSYERFLAVPDGLLKQWSAVTQAEPHLAPETPDSLGENVLMAVIAFDGAEAIGFAGLIAARTRQGHGLQHDGRAVIELGGVYIHPRYRGHGLWRRMVELRLAYAREQTWFVVCVTGNPTVQLGLAKMGAQRMTDLADRPLREELCLGCQPASACAFCPLSEGTAWKFA